MRAVRHVVVGVCLSLGAWACRGETTPTQDTVTTGGVGSVAGVGGLIGQPPGPTFAGSSGAAGSSSAGAAAPAAAGSGGQFGWAGRGAEGASGQGGLAGTPAAGGGGSAAGAAGAAGSAPVAGSGGTSEKFSFFVTSLGGMLELSGSDQGFGGDLRFGEDNGLAGADSICTELAERALPGAGKKGWRAFLSTKAGGMNGGPVHARDRIGQGPWYDRSGRLIAQNLGDLMQTRPAGADGTVANDLPNENGVPNHEDTQPDADDNHDTVTGSNAMGMYDGTPTCNDWTSTETPMPTTAAAGSGGGGRGGQGRSNGPRIGHSWPAQSGMSWMSAHQAPGCSPSVSLVQMGGGSGVGIGNGGGYGGIYCFALAP